MKNNYLQSAMSKVWQISYEIVCNPKITHLKG